ISLLGIGTVWFGRRWPEDNAKYIYPDEAEIDAYLDRLLNEIKADNGSLMIDTAPAYGRSEEFIGRYFRKNSDLLRRSFIATKWGEKFDISTGTSTLCHSRKDLIGSFKESISRLPKVDLLYIHRTTCEVLEDKEVIAELEAMRNRNTGGLRYIGASISTEKILEDAIGKELLGWADVVQLPASVFLKRPDLIGKMLRCGARIVLNSPVRRSDGARPENIFRDLSSCSEISVILTGTRMHMKEVLGYFCSSK
ncbi:MAG: aldo/keto reductase, partial [Candidatus Omnitrophica bacterium]|nr:aldo/keto reductase [Candidatus Omnitrophota bacterium]